MDFQGNFSMKYDVVVIGAGVIGCAIARHFTLEGATVLTIEKEADILEGASKGNSAILHTGFDAPPNSLEHACVVDGHQEFIRIQTKLNLPALETGALILAWTPAESDQLDQILERAHANGVHDAQRLTTKEVLAKEPHLSTKVRAGIYVPREYVIDPWTTPYAYMLQAIENGAHLIRNCELLGGEFDGHEWKITTSQGTFRGTSVINCAGLYGDLIDSCLINQTAFEIRPRKGQFLIYDKSSNHLIRSIIFPIPNKTTKGVLVSRTIFGNIIVGPESEDQESRSDASVKTATLQKLRRKGEQVCPSLMHHPITATYAGIRPATEFQDYCIHTYRDQNYISVGGIRSTGLSSALGVARYVFSEYTQSHNHNALAECVWPRINSIAEHARRDWQNQGNGGIVCHCELVTKREIQQALTGKIPVASIGGLKRRTRVTMGRCQGFYCSAQLSELTHGYFDEKIAQLYE